MGSTRVKADATFIYDMGSIFEFSAGSSRDIGVDEENNDLKG